MNWIEKLEDRFHEWTIPYFFIFLLGLQAVGFVMILAGIINDENLYLSGQSLLKGELWRLVSFLMMPSSLSLFYIFFLYIFFMIGNSLEDHWGSFKFNLFIIITYALTVITSLFHTYPVGNWYIYSAIFLAFGTIFSHVQFHLFFVVPIKVKWLAWFKAIYMLLMLLLPQERWPIISSFSAYLLFFGKDFFNSIKTYIRRQKFKNTVNTIDD